MSRRRNRRTRGHDDDDDDILNPNSDNFCRACVDMNELMGGTKSSKASSGPECPLDRSGLGRATWSVLHTFAAYFPSQPTLDEQTGVRRMIQEIGNFYPCENCKDDFKKEIIKSPPRVTNGDALSQWLCEQHNIVNLKIGKSYFDCSKVNERWKFGPPDGSCDPK